MAGFLDGFRKKILGNVYQEQEQPDAFQLNDKIALGVLLWVVAQADDKFLPEEMDKIKEVLKKITQIPPEDLPCILESVKVAAQERIDLHAFTREVSEGLPRERKLMILDNLFRVACADMDLDLKEHEMIRKISGLFRLDHKDFISAKIKVKKEFGMDTAGL